MTVELGGRPEAVTIRESASSMLIGVPWLLPEILAKKIFLIRSRERERWERSKALLPDSTEKKNIFFSFTTEPQVLTPDGDIILEVAGSVATGIMLLKSLGS